MLRRALLTGLLASPAARALDCSDSGYELRLGLSGHLAYEQGPRHEAAGLLVDLGRLLAQHTGLQLRPRIYPLPRILRMIEQGELPLAGIRLWQPGRTDIEPLLVAAPVLWVHAALAARSLEEALFADPHVVFGRLGTGSVSAWVDAKLAALPPARVERSLNADGLLRKLVVGRIHAVFSQTLTERVMLTEDFDWSLLRARAVPKAGTTVGGLQINRQRVCTVHANALHAGLRTLRDDGSLLRLLQQHLGPRAEAGMVWKRKP
ncbi:MAG: hypothetical protein ACK4F7_08985 [Inhella sp.]